MQSWAWLCTTGVALLLYVATAARTITWLNQGTDGGDLITAAWSWGIPHPTGYPLYVLLGHMLTALPIGTAAFRVELLSIVPAALACGVVTRLIQDVTQETMQANTGDATARRFHGADRPHRAPGGPAATTPPTTDAARWQQASDASAVAASPFTESSPTAHRERGSAPWDTETGTAPPIDSRGLWSAVAGIGGGLVLAVSTTFWLQATVVETYSLAVFLIAISLRALLAWERGSGTGRRYGLWQGMAIANHMLALTLLPSAALVAWRVARRHQKWSELFLLPLWLLPGLLLYALLPIRARRYPADDWGLPDTAGRFWDEVTARQYHLFLLKTPPPDVAATVLAWPAHAAAELGPVGLLLAVVGLVWLAWQRRVTLILLALVIVSDVVVSASDTAPTSPNYDVLSYMVLALAVGVAASAVEAWFPDSDGRGGAGWLAALLVCAIAGSTAWSRYAGIDVHTDTVAQTWMRSALNEVPERALIIVSGDAETFALWYGHDVLDLAPTAVVWSRELAIFPWYRQVMRRRYPGLATPDVVADRSDADSFVEAMIDTNLPRRPVYTTEAWFGLRSKYRFDRQGPLYRVRPR